jgi:WD40 repeat protein
MRHLRLQRARLLAVASLNLTLVLGGPGLAAAQASAESDRTVNLREELNLPGLMVTSLAFSPDAKWLALTATEGGAAPGGQGTVQLTLSPNGPVLLLNASRIEDRRELARGAWPDHAAFSPGGEQVVAVVDGALRAWNLKGKERWHRGQGATDVAYSPDGAHALLKQEGGRWTVVDLATGKESAPVETGGAEGLPLLFPDGQPCLVSQGEGLELRNLATAATTALAGWSGDAPSAAAFSPDGRRLAVASDAGALAIFDAATGEKLSENILSGKRVNALAFSPDGSLLAYGGAGADLWLWDIEGERVHWSFGQHKLPILGLAFSPDGGRLASSSFDGTVKLWEVGGREGGEVARHEVETGAPPVSAAEAAPVAVQQVQLGQRITAPLGRDKLTIYLVELVPHPRTARLVGVGYALYDELPPRAQKRAAKLGYGPGDQVRLLAPDGEDVQFLAEE